MINSVGLGRDSSFNAIVEGRGVVLKGLRSFDTGKHSVKDCGEITTLILLQW